MNQNLGQDLGRLFEVGFNVGILTYIEQNQLNHRFGNLYRQDLSKLSFPKMLRRLVDKEQVISEQHRHIVEKWSTFFLQKGFLAGLNFFGEYIKSTGWSKRQLKRLEILYYQCCFSDDNSIGTYPKGKAQAFKEVLSQFGLKVDIGKYAKKGEFLNADTLILLQYGKQQRVLCVDLSVFSIKSIRDLVDVDSVEVIKSILLSEISYLKSKSIFSNLGLDIKNIGFNFSKDLARYFTAFKRKDKESVKLIQAASYTHSFYEFLQLHNLTTNENSITFNVVGYSDRGISAMSLSQDNLNVLATCSDIYKHESSNQQINDARKEVLKLIQRNAAMSFQNGREFIKRLLNVPADTTTLVTHQEQIEGFLNSIDTIPPDLAAQLQVNPELHLRDAHAELIKKALASDAIYIFLTGNPGIGKTTAIADFLKSQSCLNEGFLLVYASPRKQVNLDILEKFIDENTKALCSDRIFTINTNADLIKKNGGCCTVHYLSNTRKEYFTSQTVHFINQKDNVDRYVGYANSLKRTKEDQIQDIGHKNKGVLDSICEAIYTLIDQKISNNIVATVSIQSLKKTQGGKDTLAHFEKIFRSAYNERENLVVSAEMKKISSRIKHLFIMIDEITGDDSGVEFLSRISSILQKYELTDSRHGFNTKVIVADASIVDPSVIQQHLQEKSAEPNKIFFRQATGNFSPLSVENFKFNGFKASVINTNSYPARSLNISYKVLIESFKFSQAAVLNRKHNLRNSVQAEIINDINTLLGKPDYGQIIVYIQDKPRLAELIQSLREHRGFQQYKDYIEIHANLSEQDKKEIRQYQNKVKVVFMTASASRGLSFPKTKHILVDVPRFEIEKNLMEIIQVIYRGRGRYYEDGIYKTLDDEDKELVFYLSERSVYYVDNQKLSLQDYTTEHQLSLQESVLSLLNILLVLKTSIMTRIFGFGRVGQGNYVMIPIGGKSVIAAGQTFSSKMNTLVKQLKKEHYRQPYNKRLKEVYTSLEQLLSRADIVLRNTDKLNEEQGNSYLSLRESFTTQFTKLVNNGFEELLNFTLIETGYISGSLLVIPVAGRNLEESYEMRLEHEIFKYANRELLNKLNDIRCNLTFPESLRTAINEAIELVNLLQDQPNKTQRFEQNSQRFDQYYALPLFTFISGEAMSQYFASSEEEPADQRFRDILDTYIQSVYPVGNILPIGYKYIDFPFIVFTSYSLDEIRNKIFTDKYLLTSNELNVLNLILSKDS